MDRLDRKSRDSFLDRGILRILRARSTERDETEKREPHKITSPFLLESPHTHQTPEETKKAPATFLTCATEKKEGTEGELMGIKFEKKGKKGDQRVWIICPCKNPTETDNQRKAYAQCCVLASLADPLASHPGFGPASPVVSVKTDGVNTSDTLKQQRS